MLVNTEMEIMEWCDCCGNRFPGFRAFCPYCHAKLIYIEDEDE